MTTGALRLAIPLAAMCLNVAAQVLSKRYLLKRNAVLRSEAAGFAVGLLFVVGGNIACPCGLAQRLGGAASDVLMYVTLAYGYFHFVNLSVTARRIRLLRELGAVGDDGLTRAELLERYGPRDVIGVRLDRLTGSGQIVEREGRYYGARRFPVWWAAQLITAMKLLILGKRSEFE